MKLHANAGLSLKGRELLVDRVLKQSWSLAEVSEAAGISERTACKWVARFRQEGEQGLLVVEPEDVVHPVLLGGRWCQSPSTKEKPDEVAR